jgi:hypothetical protein
MEMRREVLNCLRRMDNGEQSGQRQLCPLEAVILILKVGIVDTLSIPRSNIACLHELTTKPDAS